MERKSDVCIRRDQKEDVSRRPKTLRIRKEESILVWEFIKEEGNSSSFAKKKRHGTQMLSVREEPLSHGLQKSSEHSLDNPR